MTLPFSHVPPSQGESKHNRQPFTRGLQGMPDSQVDALPNWVKRHSSINQKQAIPHAQYSQVNCCIPKIMFWFHSSCILSHGAEWAVWCCRMPLVLPRTIWMHQAWQALAECKNKRSHFASSAFDTSRGRGFLLQHRGAREFCDAWSDARQNTTHHSIPLLLEITGPLTLLCVWDVSPICTQQISKEDVHGERAQVCSGVKEAFPMQTCSYKQFCSPVLMLSFYDDNISWPSFYLAPHSSATSNN